LKRYFSNPTGYVFITLFIFLSAAAAFWQDRFFLNNLANLEQLNLLLPYLLLFFVPALTMSVWAEEKKQGTDELLLTLPASSLDVVLGKYLAVLSVYTVSLVLSLSHVLVLFWLGSPDLGLMFANYLGYWVMGAAMIALGMLASLVTSNAAIAFILGALFCSLLVFVDSIFGGLSQWLGRQFSVLTVFPYFSDFARGVISLSGLLYFLSVAALMLLLNVLIVDRRHWPRKLEGRPTWIHWAVRVSALTIGLICLNVLVGRLSIRADATAEQLHSLSPETFALIDELSEERPVFVQAFISPEVPESYVQTRSNLIDMLREIDARAGARVQVLVHDTEPYTPEASDAREKFGIVPRQIPNLASARANFADVFLGLAFTCGAEEETIPFLDRGLPAEYEIARSIRVVARTERKKIGVLQTGINLFGGLDFQTMRSTPAWPVVDELRKQYEVVQLGSSQDFPEDLDGILVALPSSLSQPDMDRLKETILDGVPALLLADPLPVVNVGLAPSEPPGGNTNPFMRNQGPPPTPKGNIQQFMADLGVSWDSARVTWDAYNPHPDLAHLPPEVVFVGEGSEGSAPFSREVSATSGLQELVLLYPGSLEKAVDSDWAFTPLLQTGPSSGYFVYSQMIQRTFFGPQLNRNLPHRPDGREYVLAAYVQSRPAGDSAAEEATDEEESEDIADEPEPQDTKDDPNRSVRLVVVVDLDFISQQFFDIRARGPENLKFDNVGFFLNAMDLLVGDESFVRLRNKRVQHRTLQRVEAQTRDFIDQRLAEEQQAETEAQNALEEAQRRLDQRVEEVRQRPDLDARAKQIMARNLQEVENRRFEVFKANIEAEKEAKTNRARETMESQIRRIQNNIKTFAVLLPPIPIFLLGVVIFFKRQRKEREGAAAARRLRS
jgi:ABC-2 type transport system permease protein